MKIRQTKILLRNFLYAVLKDPKLSCFEKIIAWFLEFNFWWKGLLSFKLQLWFDVVFLKYKSFDLLILDFDLLILLFILDNFFISFFFKELDLLLKSHNVVFIWHVLQFLLFERDLQGFHFLSLVCSDFNVFLKIFVLSFKSLDFLFEVVNLLV